MISEKTRLMDGWMDGRATAARATAIALLTQSSRAKNVDQLPDARVSTNHYLINHKKRPMGLDALLGHLPDRNKLALAK